jgi:hypothetical protein
MYQGRLFLGFCVDHSLSEQLDRLEPELRSLLLGGGAYLEECHYHGELWLGRYVDGIKELPEFELTKNNINSLQQRFLSPDRPPKEIWLFPLVKSE